MTHSSLPYLDSFLEMLSAERGLSQNTSQAYKTDLINYFKYHASDQKLQTWEQSLELLNEDSLSEYLKYLEKNNLSVATRARHLSTIKHYVKFLQQEGHLTHNFTQTFQGPRLGKRLPKVLQEGEVEALLKSVSDLKSVDGLRLCCLLEVLYATGNQATF